MKKTLVAEFWIFNGQHDILLNVRHACKLCYGFLQGSAAADLRRGGRFNSSFSTGISECNGERIVKIAKVIVKIKVTRFSCSNVCIVSMLFLTAMGLMVIINLALVMYVIVTIICFMLFLHCSNIKLTEFPFCFRFTKAISNETRFWQRRLYWTCLAIVQSKYINAAYLSDFCTGVFILLLSEFMQAWRFMQALCECVFCQYSGRFFFVFEVFFTSAICTEHVKLCSVHRRHVIGLTMVIKANISFYVTYDGCIQWMF